MSQSLSMHHSDLFLKGMQEYPEDRSKSSEKLGRNVEEEA